MVKRAGLRVQDVANGVMDNRKEDIRRIVKECGACAVGFADAGPVEEAERKLYKKWIEDGCHGEMSYLERYVDVRNDARLLLDGAQTVISCAFDYRPAKHHELFADYALGRDYHDVVRERLGAVAEEICRRYGGATRVCVDTAPMRERYWAARAGVGSIGRNGTLIVDGIGSKVFLGEILWTGAVEADESRLGESCEGCGACARACPGKALTAEGGIDARKCNSYLTIEYRGELPADLKLSGRIYGCDICQDVCPHNCNNGATGIKEFEPTHALMALDADAMLEMTDADYGQVFKGSAIRRAKLWMLQRNLRAKE